jgi:uncharacterized protein (TIGR02996 family)
MLNRRPFLEAIRDNLDDDGVRRIYADWLEENGDPARAEFIRIQCELARLGPEDGRAATLREREKVLLDAHGPTWAVPLSRNGIDWREPRLWSRGFAHGFPYFVQEFRESLDKLLDQELLQDIVLEFNLDRDRPDVEEDAWVGELANSPHLRLVRKLNGPDSGFGPRRFAILMRSPYLTRLQDIDLFEDLIGLEGVRALVETPTPFSLKRLYLNGAINLYADEETPDAVECVRLIANSPKLAGLEYLGLYYNGLGEGAVDALVASPYLSRSLNLEFEESGEVPAALRDRLGRRFGNS